MFKIKCVIIVLVCISCSINKRTSDLLQRNAEIEIISKILSEIQLQKPVPPGLEEQKKVNIKKEANPKGYKIILKDSLLKLNQHALNYLKVKNYDGLEKMFLNNTYNSKSLDVSKVAEKVPFNVSALKDGIIEQDNGYLGLYIFSRIVFNERRTRALLFEVRSYDENTGVGRFLLLELINNEWKIVRSDMVWIS